MGGLVLLLCYCKAAAPAEPAQEFLNFSKKQKLGIASAIISGGGIIGLLYASIRFGTGPVGAHFLKDTVLLMFLQHLVDGFVVAALAAFKALKRSLQTRQLNLDKLLGIPGVLLGAIIFSGYCLAVKARRNDPAY